MSEWRVKFRSGDTIEQVGTGKRLYLFEDATYEDVFGRRLCTHFCRYFQHGISERPTPCDIYNDTSPEQ